MVKYPLVLPFSRYCYLKLCSYCHSPSQWHGAKSLIYTNENLSDRLTLYRPVSTKRSYILKQTCSFQLQVCLKYVWPFNEHQVLRVNHCIVFVTNIALRFHSDQGFSRKSLKNRVCIFFSKDSQIIYAENLVALLSQSLRRSSIILKMNQLNMNPSPTFDLNERFILKWSKVCLYSAYPSKLPMFTRKLSLLCHNTYYFH